MYTDGGVGAGENCVAMTLASLKKAVSALEMADQQYLVETTTSEEIIRGQWADACSLLVMPGGRDLPYVAKLQGRGNQIIREFVQGGGSYLGICAGGYYAASFVEFAKGDPVLEVVGHRELMFFLGTAQGPTFPGFQYDSNAGARAASIHLSEQGCRMLGQVGSTTIATEFTEPFSVYYNGGCHFVPENLFLQNFPKVGPPDTTYWDPSSDAFKVLAAYNTVAENVSKPAAILACGFGKGKVVLSGVHFEASAELLTNCYTGDMHVQALLPQIAASDSHRETLFNSIIKYLLFSQLQG